jgi:F0F1-type ATP synthase assembly protein I
VQFFANNRGQGNASNFVEQIERRYVKDGERLGTTTPTHAQFSPPDAPSGSFYRFIGWNTERDGTGDSFTYLQASTLPITKHMWLYAQWGLEREAVNTTPPTSPPGGTPSPSPTAAPTATPRPQATPTPPFPATPTPATPTPTPSQASPTPAAPAPRAPAPTAPPAAVAAPTPSETDAPDGDISDSDDLEENETDDASQNEPSEDEDDYLTIGDMDEPSGTLEIANGDTPLLGGVPLFSANGTPTWALLNLILAALGITLAMLSLLKQTITVSKEQEYEEPDSELRDDKSGKESKLRTTHKSLRLSIKCVSGVVGVLLFIIFQDITAVMVWVDYLTIAHIALFAVGIVAKRKDVYHEEIPSNRTITGTSPITWRSSIRNRREESS